MGHQTDSGDRRGGEAEQDTQRPPNGTHANLFSKPRCNNISSRFPLSLFVPLCPLPPPSRLFQRPFSSSSYSSSLSSSYIIPPLPPSPPSPLCLISFPLSLPIIISQSVCLFLSLDRILSTCNIFFFCSSLHVRPLPSALFLYYLAFSCVSSFLVLPPSEFLMGSKSDLISPIVPHILSFHCIYCISPSDLY